MTRFLKGLWADDAGAILTTEYLTLGSIVTLGSAAGLTTIKDTMNDECQAFSETVRDVNHHHRFPATQYAHPSAKKNQQTQVESSPVFMTP